MLDTDPVIAWRRLLPSWWNVAEFLIRKSSWLTPYWQMRAMAWLVNQVRWEFAIGESDWMELRMRLEYREGRLKVTYDDELSRVVVEATKPFAA